MSFVPEMSQLRGLTFEAASLFGMPNLGAVYLREDMSATSMRESRCACCGTRSSHGWSVHHEPPRSKGTFLLCTEWGRFVLLPALIVLCGSGTTGCHGKRHNGQLRIRWEWDLDEYAEKWWSGWILSHFCAPHSPRLFELGRYVFEMDGKSWEVKL